MNKLKDKGIQCSIHYPPFWSFSKYKNYFDAKNYPICSDISKRQVTLPLYPSLKEQEVEYICTSLRDIIDG